MEYIARGDFAPKRGRKASVLSGSEADIKSPLQKKPKHHHSSSNTRSHSSTSSGADYSQDEIDMDTKSLISIRDTIESLRYMEKEFHHEQQRQYEKFHQLQQKRYNELVERINDIVQWPDRKGRIYNQVVKQDEEDGDGSRDASSRLRDQTTESVASDTGSTDVGKGIAALTFSFQKINPIDLESQSSGVLNEDGAIEGVLVGSGSTGAEIREQQHRSPPPLPILSGSSDQDQLQPHPAGQNAASASNRARNTCPKSGRSLRKIPRVDYEQQLIPLGESDEDNSSLSIRAPTRTPSKAVKTPMKPKSKKMDEVPNSDDGSYRPSPIGVSTTGRASPKKKGAPKPISGVGNRNLHYYWAPTPTRKPTGGGDGQLPSSPKSDGKPEPTPNAQKDSRMQLPDASAASKFKAVRTAPVP